MIRRRWVLLRVVSSILLLGAVGLVVAIVMANILGFSSVATALQQWGFWLLWGSIGVGVVWAAIFRRGRSKRAQAAPNLSDVNQLYLGGSPSPPPSRPVSSYSAYPHDDPPVEERPSL